ncbi:GNAT family N-acetyltransferase [Chryseomicrobium sp. FSL W7-1435]|uniref:GNAT family N-acetyltransferase n=1 Tax=Chryseomicrobium sp. FSL W7-1435 TaxID=2921704 RepID=UPI00315ABB9B
MTEDLVVVSTPVDQETWQEISELVAAASSQDSISYASILGVENLKDPHFYGFCLLAYSQETDELLGFASAIDPINTRDYEWSIMVHPERRSKELGVRMYGRLSEEFEKRNFHSQTAMNPSNSPQSAAFLKKLGYEYAYSERTMKALAKPVELDAGLEIRIYEGATDREDLKAIIENAFGDSSDEVEALIEFTTHAPNRQFFLAHSGDDAVGAMTIVRESERVWVTALAVHSMARGQGVASNLLRYAQQYAHNEGMKTVYLDVETDNETALSIYERVGFQTVNHTKYWKK